MEKDLKALVWFNEVDKKDLPLVGEKGANLGELTKAEIPVPPGFIVTTKSYFQFLEEAGLHEQIVEILEPLNPDDSEQLNRVSAEIKDLITGAEMPQHVADEIREAYGKLGGLVAVRSSATAEDLPEASFAGQQRTFLNIQGEEEVVAAVQECWASLFEARAIFYRSEQGLDHIKVGIAVPVQKMVQSEVAGVMFTVEPLTNEDKITIEAVYGLGETIVSRDVTPDHYLVSKDDFTILEKQVVKQEWQLVKNPESSKGVEETNIKLPVSDDVQEKQKLSDDEIVALAKLGAKIETHYEFPQDIEWANEEGELYIVQTRPVTTLKLVAEEQVEELPEAPVLLDDSPASPGLGSDPASIVSDPSMISEVGEGDVPVAEEITTPDLVPAMKQAADIVTDVPAPMGAAKIRTKIYVNLAEPELAETIAARNVDGVGLLRAEFMISEIGEHPRYMLKEGRGEEFTSRLAEGLTTFVKAFDPRPVVYRTTDFKTNEYRHLKGGEEYEEHEENPMIGYRGCSRYIREIDIFKLEIEAVKRVREDHKNLWVMIPFVRTVSELAEIKKMLIAEGLRRSRDFKLWMMVEVPSNVFLIDKFLDIGIDGISIGSNDLTQLILGIDRDNEKFERYTDERDEAVLIALERVIKAAAARGVTSSICGQATSDFPEITEKLVEWRITSLSVSSDRIDETREIVAAVEQRSSRVIS